MAEDKVCIDCASSMNPRAVKCTSCGSYQNWRRHFALLTAVVSFALGAAAAFGLIKTPWEELVRSDVSITVERVGVTAQGYTVLIRNKGRKPAIIKYAHAFYGESHENLTGWEKTGVIGSGEDRAITFVLPTDAARPSHNDINYTRNSGDKVFERCKFFISLFAGEEVWKEIDERRDDGKCLGDYDDFISGQQSVG